MNDFYNKLEENILLNLQNKHKPIPETLYTQILLYFRTLNFNEKILHFLYQLNILTPFLLNVIHYNISNKKAFNSKNKILDLKLLFDFKQKNYGSEQYWNNINNKFKRYLKKQ